MARKKPSKPYKDFPLFPHANGQWAKKIKGKLHYFGPWAEPDSALADYLEQRDELQAGRTPIDPGLRLWELCELFLDAKRAMVDNEELSIRTWQAYQATAKKILEYLGRDVPAKDVSQADFKVLRAKLAAGRGAVSLGNEIQRVRSIFKYGFDAGHLVNTTRFGPDFAKPQKRVVRQAKHAMGPRMFQPAELRKILESAGQPLKAMVLLGINCGFGQSDVANLPMAAIDGEWIEFPRPKTAVLRKCQLWPETMDAVHEALVHRPAPRTAELADLVFITKYGLKWVRTNRSGTPDDAVGKEFAKLLKSMGIKRPGISFYALRHTFETIGQNSKDPMAVQWIMGHAARDMGSHYREEVPEERLAAVANTVHSWLWPRPWVG